MSLMILQRLPTSSELLRAGVDLYLFNDEFNQHAVSQFVAKVSAGIAGVKLGELLIEHDSWFSVVDSRHG